MVTWGRRMARKNKRKRQVFNVQKVFVDRLNIKDEQERGI